MSHPRLFRTNNAVPEYPCLAGGKLESPAMHRGETENQGRRAMFSRGVTQACLVVAPCSPTRVVHKSILRTTTGVSARDRSSRLIVLVSLSQQPISPPSPLHAQNSASAEHTFGFARAKKRVETCRGFVVGGRRRPQPNPKRVLLTPHRHQANGRKRHLGGHLVTGQGARGPRFKVYRLQVSCGSIFIFVYLSSGIVVCM